MSSGPRRRVCGDLAVPSPARPRPGRSRHRHVGPPLRVPGWLRRARPWWRQGRLRGVAGFGGAARSLTFVGTSRTTHQPVAGEDGTVDRRGATNAMRAAASTPSGPPRAIHRAAASTVPASAPTVRAASAPSSNLSQLSGLTQPRSKRPTTRGGTTTTSALPFVVAPPRAVSAAVSAIATIADTISHAELEA